MTENYCLTCGERLASPEEHPLGIYETHVHEEDYIAIQDNDSTEDAL